MDQFVSIDSGKYVGEVTTRAFTFSGRQLYLNVAGREDEIDVRVEILGPASHIIPGFTFEDADPIKKPWTGTCGLVERHLRSQPAAREIGEIEDLSQARQVAQFQFR